MKRRELYEKLYFHEIEQKDKLDSRLQFPLAIIVALLGFLGFLLENDSSNFETTSIFFFWVGWFCALVALIHASYHFVRALWGNTYTYLATARKCDDYYRELVASYSEKPKSKKLARKKFEQYIVSNFKEHSSTNGLLNDRRSLRIYLSIRSLIVAIFFSMISFGGHYIGKLETKSNFVAYEETILIKDAEMTKEQTPAPTKNETPVSPPEPRKVIEDNSPRQSDRVIVNEKTEGE